MIRLAMKTKVFQLGIRIFTHEIVSTSKVVKLGLLYKINLLLILSQIQALPT